MSVSKYVTVVVECDECHNKYKQILENHLSKYEILQEAVKKGWYNSVRKNIQLCPACYEKRKIASRFYIGDIDE